MSIEYLPLPSEALADRVHLAVIQGPGNSGKSMVANELSNLGFTAFGLGDKYRRITSAYITRYPDQVDNFCPHMFNDYMKSSEDEVQAVMRELIAAPHEDLRHPDVQNTVALVAEADVSQQVVNDYGVEILSRMRGLVFMEGRALEEIIYERARAGQFGGRVIANLFIDVSDEVAKDRSLLDAESKGVTKDPEQELRDIKSRNERDRTRLIYPMVLPENAYQVLAPIEADLAQIVGYNAAAYAENQDVKIPRCVRLMTDKFEPKDTPAIAKNVTIGGLMWAIPNLELSLDSDRIEINV